MVAFAPDGSLRGARASAHSGFNGTAPWWEQAADDWAPYRGVAYRASGSHALGFRRTRPRSGRRRLERRSRRPSSRAPSGWSRPIASALRGLALRSGGRAALGQGRVAQPGYAAHERRGRRAEPDGRGCAHLGEGVRAGCLVKRTQRVRRSPSARVQASECCSAAGLVRSARSSPRPLPPAAARTALPACRTRPWAGAPASARSATT